jgi:hypothetical protein
VSPPDGMTEAEAAVSAAIVAELVKLALEYADGSTDKIRALLDAEDAVIEANADARAKQKFPGG